MTTLKRNVGQALVLALAIGGASPVWAGSWVATPTTTNANGTSTSNIAGAVATSVSHRTGIRLSASLAAPTDGAKFAEATGSYSGTWTFRWQPDNANDWPSSYTIKSVHTRSYMASVQNASGTSAVSTQSGTPLVTATLPGTALDTQDFPEPTVVTDTTDPNLTVTTVTTSFETKRRDATKMIHGKNELVLVKRVYASNWFTTNFSDPASVEITFVVDDRAIKARIDADATGTGVIAAVSAAVADLFFGE